MRGWSLITTARGSHRDINTVYMWKERTMTWVGINHVPRESLQYRQFVENDKCTFFGKVLQFKLPKLHYLKRHYSITNYFFHSVWPTFVYTFYIISFSFL